ncbi:hypothetical protein DDZ14_07500 [Maritimibacter sp. 55A14]|uniref:FkbM family methyltransferase n=1 Tax=Maritimibacter sp. 55A14 TaxID=2174844 RepID=UPI000D612B86|nr:FkbM family methyltransferase [Maritimibacter sp. 55A14]PWE32927.1 hypothetical protein DDZ14_07500 [Maritimibacter sp. 55A14]
MNASFDPEVNGEFFLLRSLQGSQIKTAFDVGANDGDHAGEMLAALPDTRIFAFEMDSEISEKLNERFIDENRVTVVNIGLSDRRGNFEYFFNSAGNHSGTTMFYDPAVRPNKYSHEERSAKFVTGDEFCSDAGLDSLDFLKVDTEGADFAVLKGFSDMLSNKNIRLLQFEYNFHAFNARVFLYDFYKLLESFDYKVGRLFPKGVDFSPYSIEYEGLKGMYVAVSSSEQKMLNTLSYKPPHRST